MLEFIQNLGEILEKKRAKLQVLENGSKVDEIENSIITDEIEDITYILEATNHSLDEFGKRVDDVRGQTTSTSIYEAIEDFKKRQLVIC